jgi:hypothetical protein
VAAAAGVEEVPAKASWQLTTLWCLEILVKTVNCVSGKPSILPKHHGVNHLVVPKLTGTEDETSNAHQEQMKKLIVLKVYCILVK